jgi:hypothetical protein
VRPQVRESMGMLPRMVGLLDTLSDHQGMKIVLQVLGNLSKDAESKLEIGRLNGFQKMFALLVVADDELQTEILKTLRFFLQLESVTSGVATDVSGTSDATKATGSIRRVHSNSDLSSSSAASSAVDNVPEPAAPSSQRFSIPKWGHQILTQLPKSAIYHLQRLFYKTVFPSRHSVSRDTQSAQSTTTGSADETANDIYFPPSFEAIAEMLGSPFVDQAGDQLAMALNPQSSESVRTPAASVSTTSSSSSVAASTAFGASRSASQRQSPVSSARTSRTNSLENEVDFDSTDVMEQMRYEP